MRKALFILGIGAYISLNAQVPSYIPTNGLTGWWPFTGNANDMSGNGNNGVVNGATLITDRFGNPNAAYNFTGSANIITSFSAAITGDWSISSWYYKTGTSNFNAEYYLGFGNLREGNGFGFGGAYNSCGTNEFCLYDGNGTTGCFIGDIITGVMNYVQWTNIVIVKSGGTYSIYSNGVLAASGTLNSSISLNELVIGMRADNQLYFNGYVDDIGSWNRALDTTEIKNIHLSQTTGIKQLIVANNQINLYPNPNNGNFVIEATGKQTVQVYDITGKLVLNQTINGKTHIDASALNEGVYIVSITGGEGFLNKKLVIAK